MNVKEKLINKRIVTVFLFLIITAVLVYCSFLLFGDYYYSWKIGHDYKKFEQAYLDYLKKDTYGGKTPEETYNRFVETLRLGDIDSASKYFYWERQEKEKQRFLKMKEEGKLEEYVVRLPMWEEMREDNDYNMDMEGGKRYSWSEILNEPVTLKLPAGDGGFVEHTFKPGEYKQEITFWINKQANIWKIYSL